MTSDERLGERFLANWDVDPAFSAALIRDLPTPGNLLSNDTLDRQVSLAYYVL